MKIKEFDNFKFVSIDCDIMRAFDEILTIDEIKRTIQKAANVREFSFVFNNSNRSYVSYKLRQHSEAYDLDELLIDHGVTNYVEIYDFDIAHLVRYYVEIREGDDFKWQAFMIAGDILQHVENHLTAIDWHVELIKFEFTLLQVQS